VSKLDPERPPFAHILEYTDVSGGLGAVNVSKIDAIWPALPSDISGGTLPDKTVSVISTADSECHCTEDSAILIARWKRQLAQVLYRG